MQFQESVGTLASFKLVTQIVYILSTKGLHVYKFIPVLTRDVRKVFKMLILAL